MRSWFAPTVDHASDGLSEKTGSYFSMLSRTYDESGVRYRAPLSFAIASVAFQQYPQWIGSTIKVALYGLANLNLLAAGILLCGLLAASARTSRVAVAIFIVIAVV